MAQRKKESLAAAGREGRRRTWRAAASGRGPSILGVAVGDCAKELERAAARRRWARSEAGGDAVWMEKVARAAEPWRIEDESEGQNLISGSIFIIIRPNLDEI